MDPRPLSTVSETLATALNTPLPDNDQASFLEPPKPTYMQYSNTSSPRESYAASTPRSNNTSGALLPAVDKVEANEYPEEQPRSGPRSTKRKPLLILVGLLVLAIIVLVIVLPVWFTVGKRNQRNQDAQADSGSNASSPTPSASSDPTSPGAVISGGDGSIITMEDGSTFTYNNKFDGFWVSDPNDPFNNNARPNSWTPPLNQSWTWGKDRVYGVNLGGLFVLEPFISPALYQKYPGATDEWSLSELMAADTASGGLNQLEEHYKTFVTEKDIAEIAGAGLNWVRIPVPFWAIDKLPSEPFLEKISWKYILRVLGWCRKYGLRVNLDLHTIPGSQNAYNHSGKGGIINFLNGVMGMANAQRALNYIRIFTEFISQPQYKDLVPMFSIMNEPLRTTIGPSALTSFYLEAHTMIRNITGLGEGNGPYIAIHDSFNLGGWDNFLPGSDRIAIDTHPYLAFRNAPATDPIATGTGSEAGGIWPAEACSSWGGMVNNSRSSFGVTIAGEFSNGFNDCGLFLKGVPGGDTSYGGNCADWEDSSNWSAATKAGLRQFALASMDALQDFFFWTWKIGNSTAGIVEAPLWSYQLGLENGWMPKDPRKAIGVCAAVGAAGPPFDGKFQPTQTGGAGAGNIEPAVTAEFPWPPSAIANADAPVSLLPTYTSTGAVATLPPPTFTPTPTKSIDAGNGWFNSQDTAGAPTPIAGCSYPPAWEAVGVAVPSLC